MPPSPPRSIAAERIALGTAQFGQDYGVANRSGQVTLASGRAIIAEAAAAGMNTLDTAIAYGASEQRLGEIGVDGWRVVSKLPPMPDEVSASHWVRESVDGSLQRLGIPRLYGLLLHRSANLFDPRGRALHDALCAERDAGRVQKIGVSIYAPEELSALEGRFTIDMVQAPYNVIDRRIETSGWLERLSARGIEVHTRSTFLQGLLLMDAAARPAKFDRFKTLFDRIDAWVRSTGSSALQATLGFVIGRPGIDCAVVGVDSREQLAEIVAAAIRGPVEAPASLATDDLALINPSNWRDL